MGISKEIQRLKINSAAQNFLCEPETDGDLYDAYLILCEARERGEGNQFAVGKVNVSQAFEVLSVDAILDMIDAAVANMQDIPAFIEGIDWKLLKDQKASLLKVIDNCDNVEILGHLEGILSLIDALQDYACDDLQLGDAIVFPGIEDIWGEIRTDNEDNGIITVDAWTTDDDDEEGKVIARINIKTGDVEYLDERARTNNYAQEEIQNVLKNIVQ